MTTLAFDNSKTLPTEIRAIYYEDLMKNCSDLQN